MFCQKCGTQLEDTANFCNKCGNEVNKVDTTNVEKENIKDTEVMLHLKPKFFFWYMALPGIFIFILFFLCLHISPYADSVSLPVAVIGMVLVAILVIAMVLIERECLKKTNYRFYKTKVEYSHTSFGQEWKEVKYKYIRETSLSRNLIDKYLGIGTIILYTNAESGANNGIRIPYIEDPETAYKYIKQLLEENNR